MKKNTLINGLLALMSLFAGQIKAGGAALPVPSASQLPRWRGFNLLNYFMADWNQGSREFKEEELRWISEWGFNFVRLPLDYRLFIKDKDWRQPDLEKMAEIIRVVEWGGKYGIHVCVNLHRAPGYCINPPKEAKSVWSDEEALEVCELHWRVWAMLLKAYGNDRVSFNLFNEPTGVDAPTYARVAGRLIKAIHEVSPGRLVILDGIDGGSTPVPELKALGAAQAMRGYNPFDISHYKAEWAGSWEDAPLPVWPPLGLNGYLYGSAKKELQRTLRITGGLEQGGSLGLHVDSVSSEAVLEVSADGKQVFSHHFKPGPGLGEWKKSDFKPEWKIYQGLYDRVYEAKLPVGTQSLEIRVTDGDWLTLTGLSLDLKGRRTEIPCSGRAWGVDPGALALDTDGQVPASFIKGASARLLLPPLKPWLELRGQGVGIMVGEWGAYNKTPHVAVLAWMEDHLKLWKQAGLGWALWNFSGSFGVLDSGRLDVQYVDWHGHKLDKKMLDLLRRY
jgi:hypothetical protein